MKAPAWLVLVVSACAPAPKADTAPPAKAVEAEDEGGGADTDALQEAEEPNSLDKRESDKDLDNLADAERALADDQQALDRLLAQPIASTTDAACRKVCASLASMRRSVDAICRLSDEAARCQNAKKTLGKNESRVADAGCRC